MQYIGVRRIHQVICSISGRTYGCAPFFRQSHYEILDRDGIRYVMEDKPRIFTGCLYVYVAKIQYARYDTGYLARHVLNAGKSKFTDPAGEKILLFDVDDTFVGYDPNIEIQVDPDEKNVQPEEEQKRILQEREESLTLAPEENRRYERQGDECSDNDDGEEDRNQKAREDIEPVTMVDGNDGFPVVFARKTDQ